LPILIPRLVTLASRKVRESPFYSIINRDEILADAARLDNLVGDAIIAELEVSSRFMEGRIDDGILADNLGHEWSLLDEYATATGEVAPGGSFAHAVYHAALRGQNA
jgi:hypothetical protein